MGLTPSMFGHLLAMLGGVGFVLAGISAGILRLPHFAELLSGLGLIFISLVMLSWLFSS